MPFDVAVSFGAIGRFIAARKAGANKEARGRVTVFPVIIAIFALSAA